MSGWLMSKNMCDRVSFGDLARRLNVQVISPLTICTTAFEMPSEASVGSIRSGLDLDGAYWCSTASIFNSGAYLHMTMLEFDYFDGQKRFRAKQEDETDGQGYTYHFFQIAEPDGKIGASRIGHFGPEHKVNQGRIVLVHLVLEQKLAS